MGMPVIKPSRITREQSIADIISSIAEEETSLAHILNAESEKLQAVITNPEATAEELLAINKSVKASVDIVIKLEIVLASKLKMFAETICQIF